MAIPLLNQQDHHPIDIAQLQIEEKTLTENGTAVAPMMDLCRTTPQFIGGKLAAGEGEAFSVLNPSDGSEVAQITGASTDQVEQMIAKAKEAQPAWGALSREERIAILKRFILRLRVHLGEVREVLMAEGGALGGSAQSALMTMAFQTETPTQQAEDILDLYLSLPETVENPIPLDHRISPAGKIAQSMMRYTPIGVVAGIAAYNYPYLTALWKVIPSLVTGNVLILRPSPLTPISSLVFAQAAIEAELPEGVLSVMIEGGIQGAQMLTTHPGVDMVAFTGSSQVGKLVMKQAADTMKRLQLELGGKSAQIFLPDAVDQAINGAIGVCVAHAGQGCALGTRIFVPEEAKADLVQGMKAAFAHIKTGPAEADDSMLGPVISEAQVERCEHFVKIAVEAGATIVTGGKRSAGLGNGYFFEPTVLDMPDNSNPAAQEEIFGPVVSVIGYRDLDHAVEMANDSPYGLSGYVWGNDTAQALSVAKRLESGSVNVNGGFYSAYSSSGGQKLSGIARERGPEGLRLYQNSTNLTLCG